MASHQTANIMDCAFSDDCRRILVTSSATSEWHWVHAEDLAAEAEHRLGPAVDLLDSALLGF